MREINQAVDALRAGVARLDTTDEWTIDELAEGVRATSDVREANTVAGGRLIAMLRERGVSWREIERLTGVAQSNARRWHEPPPS